MSDNSFAGINFDDPNTKNIFKYREKNMCDSWNVAKKKLFLFDIDIMKNPNNDSFVINGKLKGDILNLSLRNNLYLKYWASNTPTYNSNFSGSGLPYPTEEIAFENSNNHGVAKINNGNFSFSMRYPNSYYKNMGTEYVFPEAMVKIFDTKNTPVSNIQHINLGEGIPFRTLTWPWQRDWNEGSLFYKVDNLPVRNQYQILLDSAYPKNNTMPQNFWGLKPPN